MLEPEDLTPLFELEWDNLIRAEYSEVVLSKHFYGAHWEHQCRVMHPFTPITVCIRKRGHTGPHGSVNPVSLWIRSVRDVRRT